MLYSLAYASNEPQHYCFVPPRDLSTTEPSSISSETSLLENQITRAVYTLTIMEKYREDYIALILSDAGSIHEVTLGHVEDLKYMQAGRIVLDKFEATVQDFEYWGAKDQLSSVEYDSQSRRVLVKSVEGSSLYGFPNSCLHAYMETMACKLSSLTSASSLSGESNYTNVGRTG